MAESTLSLHREALARSTAFYLGYTRLADVAEGLTATRAANVTAAVEAGERKFLSELDWEFLTPRLSMTLWTTKTGTCTVSGTTVTATTPKFFSTMIGHEILIESILNGTFAADTDWTKGAGWTIADGIATATGAISTDLSQTVNPLIVGLTYRVTFTITRTAGSITPVCGTASGTARTEDGTYTEDIVATSTTVFKFSTSGFTGTIDDVTVEAVHTITAYTSSTVVTIAATGTTTSKAFTVTANGRYRMPDDFGGVASDEILFDANDGDDRIIRITSEPLIIEVWQLNTNTLRPTQAAFVPLTIGTTGQRWDMVIAPMTDADYVVSFRYNLLADAVAAGLYPYGGMQHAETLRLACLAAAEEMFYEEQTKQRLLYERALLNSKRIDRRMKAERLGIGRPRVPSRQRPEYERCVSGGAYGVTY